MTAIRSVSFLRSSSAPLTIVSPVAAAAAMNRIGNSSMASGTSSGGTAIPLSSLCVTQRSATGSAPTLRWLRSSIEAPISRRIASRPVRVGLIPTFSISNPSRAPRQPATRKNAAELKSAGTRTSKPRNVAGPFSVTVCPAPSVDRPRRTPMLCSMRSVWSRLGPGDRTVVVPLARSAASNSADLTCALAIGNCVVDTREALAAAHGDRGPAATRCRDACAHEPERRGDSLHRALAQRRVACELAGERLSGEQPHQQPDSRARVAEVENLGRRAQPAGARAFDSHEAFRLALDGDAHGLESPLGGETILAREKTMNDRRPFCDRTEHQRAMRDGLVAGDGDSAADVRRRYGTKAVRML